MSVQKPQSIDLKTIARNTLFETATMEKILAEANRLTCFVSRETKNFAEQLMTLLNLSASQEMSDAERKYWQAIVGLRFAGLYLYTNIDVEHFFQYSIVDALGREEFDLWWSVRAKLIEIPIIERDDFKDRLRTALQRNEEPLPGHGPTINDQKVESTIKNWFRDYLTFVGVEHQNQIKRVQYFAYSKNFIQLDKPSQQKFRQACGLFERLGIPSVTPEGIEESVSVTSADGELLELQSGRLVSQAKNQVIERLAAQRAAVRQPERYTPAVVSRADGTKRLKEHYQGYRKNRKLVLAAEDRIMIETKGDVQALRRVLSAASRNQEKQQLIACLKILAREQALVPALQSSPAWLQAVAEYVSRKYQKRSTDQDLLQWTASIKAGAVSVPVVSEFLQYLLKEKISLSENNSALVGVEIGKLLGSSYEPIAYGNEETGEFEWSTFELMDGKLIPEK